MRWCFLYTCIYIYFFWYDDLGRAQENECSDARTYSNLAVVVRDFRRSGPRAGEVRGTTATYPPSIAVGLVREPEIMKICPETLPPSPLCHSLGTKIWPEIPKKW